MSKQFRHLKPYGKGACVDRYTTRASELLKPYESGAKGAYGLVGLPLSKTSISHSGASFAPGAIREALSSYTVYSGEKGANLTEEIIDFGDVYLSPTNLIENQHTLYKALVDVFEAEVASNYFLLGGDHGVSYAAIKAYAEHQGNVGVIQFDAHHDLRNTEDGGPTNGTPFRRLLEDDILKGENLVQIGIRDFTNAKAYDDYAKEQGVTVYTMGDVNKQSLTSILNKEVQNVAEKVDHIYISLDMDVHDQAFAPGCPAIGPGGMDSTSLLEGIHFMARHEKVNALDIVEIDPTIDFRNMTSRVAAYTMLQFMKGKK